MVELTEEDIPFFLKMKGTPTQQHSQLNATSFEEQATKELLLKDLTIADHLIQIEHLKTIAVKADKQAVQIQELNATVEELSAIAYDLHNQLSLCRQQHSGAATPTGSPAHLQDASNQSVAALIAEHSRLNEINDEIHRRHLDVEKKLQARVQQLQDELTALATTAEHTVAEIASQRDSLAAQLQSVAEEASQSHVIRQALEAECRDKDEQLRSLAGSPKSADQDKCNSVLRAELDEVTAQLAATKMELQRMREDIPELDRWHKQEEHVLNQIKKVLQENGALRKNLKEQADLIGAQTTRITDLESRVLAAKDEQQKLMLTPPSIAGLELRCARLANLRLQEAVLKAEQEICEQSWAAASVVARPQLNYDELLLKRKLHWRTNVLRAALSGSLRGGEVRSLLLQCPH